MLHWLELNLRLGAELDASDGKTLLVRAVTGGAFGDWCRTQNLERAFRIQQNVWRKSWFVHVCSVSSERNLTLGTNSICTAWIHPFVFRSPPLLVVWCKGIACIRCWQSKKATVLWQSEAWKKHEQRETSKTEDSVRYVLPCIKKSIG